MTRYFLVFQRGHVRDGFTDSNPQRVLHSNKIDHLKSIRALVILRLGDNKVAPLRDATITHSCFKSILLHIPLRIRPA